MVLRNKPDLDTRIRKLLFRATNPDADVYEIHNRVQKDKKISGNILLEAILPGASTYVTVRYALNKRPYESKLVGASVGAICTSMGLAFDAAKVLFYYYIFN